MRKRSTPHSINKPKRGKLFLIGLLAVLAMATAGITGCAGNLMHAQESFTEFYILGAKDRAAEYPQELRLGEDGTLTLSVVNREGRDSTYTVDITLNGIVEEHFGPVILANGQKWVREASFTPSQVGYDQKVEFLLYKEGYEGVYRQLHIWVHVFD